MEKEKIAANLPPEYQQRFQKLVDIIEEQQKKISALESRPAACENPTFTYLRMYHQFLQSAQVNNWLIDYKYETKNTHNYIDIDFVKYKDFIKDKFNTKEQRQFKDFLLDLNLICSDTFYSKHRKIVTGSGKEKKRIFRVPKEVFFHFTQGSADIAS